MNPKNEKFKVIWNDRCCNPFKIKGHKVRNVRRITANLLVKFPTLFEGSMLCNLCRKKASKLNEMPDSLNNENVIDVDIPLDKDSENDQILADDNQDDDDINKDLNYIISGFKNDHINRNSEVSNPSENIMQCIDENHLAAVEVLDQIKEKFTSSKSDLKKNSTSNTRPKILVFPKNSGFFWNFSSSG